MEGGVRDLRFFRLMVLGMFEGREVFGLVFLTLLAFPEGGFLFYLMIP